MNLELLIEDLEKRAGIFHEDIYVYLKHCGYDIPNKNRLVFKVVDKKGINGRSWCFENKDYIEINKDGIKRIYEYFLDVNKYYKKEILNYCIPHEEEEKIGNMSMEGVYCQSGILVQFDSKTIDDERAMLLVIFGTRFLLTHEMGHIFNGHCSFLNSKEKNLKYIAMYYLDDTSEKSVSALDFRTMDMDADGFAVTQSIRHVIFLYKTFYENVTCQWLKPLELFYWWAFAIRSQFLLCEDYCWDSMKYVNEMKHLPCNARWTMTVVVKIVGSFN
jgi:hypothetical protein